MPGFDCSFCAHRNPDGSKFCNECGSPLHLAPCPQCDAINNLSDERCNRCGAPLSGGDAEPAPALAAASSGDAGSMEPAARAGDPVPLALADRMEDFPWAARPARSPVPAVEPDEPTVGPMVAAAIEDPIDATGPAPHATGPTYYEARKPRRAPSIVLAVLLVGVAGGIYWSSLSRVQPTQPGAVTVEAQEHSNVAPAPAVPTVEPKSEASNATQQPTPTTPTTAAREAPEAASTQPASSPANATAASVSTEPDREAPPRSPEPSKAADTSPPIESPSKTADAPTAAAEPSKAADAPPAAAQPRRTADAPVASEIDPANSTETRPAKSSARRGDDARRRTPPYMRTREQAERDALATQRLIARDLGSAAPPRAAPGAGSTP